MISFLRCARWYLGGLLRSVFDTYRRNAPKYAYRGADSLQPSGHVKVDDNKVVKPTILK